jgi:hypothetical protein
MKKLKKRNLSSEEKEKKNERYKSNNRGRHFHLQTRTMGERKIIIKKTTNE